MRTISLFLQLSSSSSLFSVLILLFILFFHRRIFFLIFIYLFIFCLLENFREEIGHRWEVRMFFFVLFLFFAYQRIFMPPHFFSDNTCKPMGVYKNAYLQPPGWQPPHFSDHSAAPEKELKKREGSRVERMDLAISSPRAEHHLWARDCLHHSDDLGSRC